LLDQEWVAYRYRDYVREPLSEEEIRRVLRLLGASPREVLRRNDRAYREAGLDGSEDDDTLVALMAAHPTLLQRPIGILGTRAAVGRPPERLLELVAASG